MPHKFEKVILGSIKPVVVNKVAECLVSNAERQILQVNRSFHVPEKQSVFLVSILICIIMISLVVIKCTVILPRMRMRKAIGFVHLSVQCRLALIMPA